MSFEPSSLFLSLIVGSVGFVLLIYGKKQQRWPHMIAGLLFMVYPYFVDGFLMMAAIGAALGGVLWWLLRQGY
jgi:hypothetical protein